MAGISGEKWAEVKSTFVQEENKEREQSQKKQQGRAISAASLREQAPTGDPWWRRKKRNRGPARAMRATTHVVAHTWKAFSGISFCFRKRYLFDPTSTMAGGGDDFDDDFHPDELVALSDDEAGEGVDLEDVGHSAEGADEEDDQDPTPNDRSVEDKKRKRKEKMKEKKRAGRAAARTCFDTSARAHPVGPPSVQAKNAMRVRSSTGSLSMALSCGRSPR